MAKSLIHNKDFVLFGLQPWDIEIGSNFKNMALEISKTNRVLYVNYPADRISVIRNRKQQRIQNRMESIRTGKNVLTMQEENLWVMNPPVVVESINWLPAGKVYDRINFFNCKRLAQHVNGKIKDLRFQDPVLMIDNDFLRGFFLPDLVPHDSFIFYIRDFLLSQPYFKKHGTRLEKKMIAKSDATVCNSAYQANYASAYNKNAFDIGQGCDVEIFLDDEHERPADIKNIRGPVIGYCGALLASRLDITLLVTIAKNKPEWNFVFVGPEDDAFKQSELHQLQNVYFPGAKPFDQLPAYVHHFDVCINPQAINQMTVGNYPRKIDEYLAAGKPTVATQTPAMEPFSEHVYLGLHAEDYIRNIGLALEDRDSKRAATRRLFAQSHTWEASIAKLYSVIENVTKTEIHAAG